MAQSWVRLLHEREDVDLVGLVDIDREVAARLASRFELDGPLFVALPEALAAAQPDLVIDTCVPEARFEIVTTALAAGCHVLSEKPMATSMEDARALVEAARRAERTFAVMQNRRYLPGTRAMRELVSGGAIGRPGFACADFFIGPHFGGFREAMANPLLVDMAIHTFDQARFIAGADALSAYCHEFNTPGSWFEGNACAICIFELSNGAVFCYRGSWVAEGAPTSWEATWRVVGSSGTAIWDGQSQPYAEIVEPDGEGFLRPVQRVEAKSAWNGRHQHAGCIDEMLAALREGRSPETDCTDNLKSIAMVLGAVESARLGQKINIPA
jgi:predicted dehydrogenase